MFELMDDWETKKTDHRPGKKLWIGIGGILEQSGIGVKDFEDLRKLFNATSPVGLKSKATLTQYNKQRLPVGFRPGK